jgi:PKD repeat protein
VLFFTLLVQPVFAGSSLTVSGEILPSSGAPVAWFSGFPTSGTPPLVVQFTDQSTNFPTSWKWEYRQGPGSWKQFATNQHPSFTFSSSGTYDIRLTVTNAGGTDDELKKDYIIVSNQLAPVVQFSATPATGSAPLTVKFTDESTNTPTSWKWELQKDTGRWMRFATTKNPSYTFLSAGTYSIRLTAANKGGSDEETKIGFITVTTPVRPPVARFTQDFYIGSAPLTVHFTDRSLNDPTSFFWQFGDGSTSSDKNPYHTYTRAGFYVIRERVSNEAGSDTASSGVFILRNGWWWFR